ncbi:MAG TPA: hypothetical protein VF454_04110 [Gemmatimonadales bacterium]
MRKNLLLVAGLLAALVACNEAPFTTPESGDATGGPALATAATGRNTVVVNPNANGNGVAATIQEGIEMAGSGGRVLIKPGIYAESLFILNGVTLEPLSPGLGDVVLVPPAWNAHAIQVISPEPVVIRGLTVMYPGNSGVRSDGPGDILLEDLTVSTVNPTKPSNAVVFLNDPFVIPWAGGQARGTIIGSRLDGGILTDALPHPQSFGIRALGNVTMVARDNLIRHFGGACIIVSPRNDLTGMTNADLVGNDVDDCFPAQRVSAIVVGVTTAATPFTATGTVNIIGNTIRNTSATCLITSAIAYQNFTGRIEHNTIAGFVQGCATPTARNRPSAISLGSRSGITGGLPSVRFNDVLGNAFAGLQLEQNVATLVDARCNWWGAADGPSGLGAGSGDAILVDGAAPTPTYFPYATTPIAGTGATGC